MHLESHGHKVLALEEASFALESHICIHVCTCLCMYVHIYMDVRMYVYTDPPDLYVVHQKYKVVDSIYYR